MATTTEARPEGPPRPPGTPRSRVLLGAGVSGLVAVLCALLLPFAPVAVNESTVS